MTPSIEPVVGRKTACSQMGPFIGFLPCAQALDKTAADNGSFLAFNHYPPTKNYWK